jgi:hypothetical protein
MSVYVSLIYMSFSIGYICGNFPMCSSVDLSLLCLETEVLDISSRFSLYVQINKTHLGNTFQNFGNVFSFHFQGIMYYSILKELDRSSKQEPFIVHADIYRTL